MITTFSFIRTPTTASTPLSLHDALPICRVLVIDSATLPPEARLAVAEVSQTSNGFRVKMHDKHAALVRSGEHTAELQSPYQVRWRFAIGKKKMSAEEWKKQFVREGRSRG